MGGRKETVSDEELLSYVAEVDEPFLSTSEIADHFDFGNPGMNKRLYRLENSGYLDQKTAGGTNIWWLTDAGEHYLEATEE